MLSNNFLSSNLIFSSLAHTPLIVEKYFEQLDLIFGLIRECESGREVMPLLNGPVCHSGFKRLN
jgi:hypothetical protein